MDFKFSGKVSANSLQLGASTTIASSNTGGSKTFTVPDSIDSCDFLLVDGPQTATGAKTFTSPAIIKGVIDGSNASEGDVGEYKIETINIPSFTGNVNYITRTSILLTPGDWEITACANWFLNSGTAPSSQYLAVSTTNNSVSGATPPDTIVQTSIAATGMQTSAFISCRKNISTFSGSMYFYLTTWETTGSVYSNFSGKIAARRVR